jgi:glycosyltransferase involved in cell wall biosynthesis
MGAASLSILMVSPQFRPIVGGYERAAERLSTALATQDHRVTVLAERRDSAWPKHEEQSGVRIRRLWCLHRPRLHQVTSLLRFAAYLLTTGGRFDVWHVHQYGMHAVGAILLGRLLGRPVLLKLTGSGALGIGRMAATLPWPRLTNTLLRRVDAVVATSPETRTEAIAFGIAPDKVQLIVNGVDTTRFKPRDREAKLALRRELHIAANGMVLFVGRLSAEKNPDGLLSAWRQIVSRVDDGWKLVLIGDGPMRDELMDYVNTHQLGDHVQFTGQQANIESWMAAADLFVLPSHHEGLSNSLLEAMSSGLAVASTRVSGSTGIFAEADIGELAEVGDTDSLATAIIRLIQDSERREHCGARARLLAESKFSVSVVAEQMVALYRKLLDRRVTRV